MSSDDFLPKGDRQLVTWGSRFVSVATANSTAVGIQSAALSTYTTNTEFNNSILLVETKKAELKAAVKAKNDKRKQVTTQARTFNRFGQFSATGVVYLSETAPTLTLSKAA